MSVKKGEHAVVLEGHCPVEDAEPLLQLLQSNPTVPLDWRQCQSIHTAVLQVILAAKPKLIGPCADFWTERWLRPSLR